MTIEEFQCRALATAIYPNRGNNLAYPVLGLVGESGEVAEKVKKMIRDDGGFLTPDRRAAIIKELGDVLWYVAATAHELSATLEDVAQGVLDKLDARKSTGTLNGDGDNRESKASQP